MKTDQEKRNDARYRRLRAGWPHRYTQCANTATAIALRHNLDLKAAATIEATLVAFALELIDAQEQQSEAL